MLLRSPCCQRSAAVQGCTAALRLNQEALPAPWEPCFKNKRKKKNSNKQTLLQSFAEPGGGAGGVLALFPAPVQAGITQAAHQDRGSFVPAVGCALSRQGLSFPPWNAAGVLGSPVSPPSPG